MSTLANLSPHRRAVFVSDVHLGSRHCHAAELARFLHHIHWIPQSRGITDAFVDEHFPGRTWQGLLLVLEAAGIFVGRGGSPPRLMPTVGMLHFTDAMHWAVQWEDGVVTASSAR